MFEVAIFMASFLLLFALPLLGAIASGDNFLSVINFPIGSHGNVETAFYYPLFALYLSVFLAVLCFSVYVFIRGSSFKKANKASFPWWGYLSAFVCFVSWVVAWYPIDFVSAYRSYTFAPLWIGFILFLNALSYSRTSESLLTSRPLFFFSLFVASSMFWWYFEFLNSFVSNWHYSSIDSKRLVFDMGLAHLVSLSIAFSTVLPGVASVHCYLGTYRSKSGYLLKPCKVSPFFKYLMLCVGTFSLLLIGVFPDILYSFLWLAPLMLITSIQSIFKANNIWSELGRGDFYTLATAAISALICGVFWEMWNYYSVSKWHYTIPYLNDYYFFEMPVVGMAGYMPFGLECLILYELISASIYARED